MKTLFIAPGSPWENGYSESFNSRFRDEFLDRELFTSGQEASVLAEQFRVDYNLERPHMSLGYLTPAEFAARSAGPVLLPRCAGEASDSPGVRPRSGPNSLSLTSPDVSRFTVRLEKGRILCQGRCRR